MLVISSKRHRSLKSPFLWFVFLLATLVPNTLGNRSEWLPDASERHCLTQALWHEARGEPDVGIRAVATVILNRVDSGLYGATICKVINQHKQFSFIHLVRNKSIAPKPTEVPTLVSIHQIVQEVQQRKFKPVFDADVLHYHTTKVNPYWSKKMLVVAVIGSHKFMKAKQSKA